MASWPWSSCSSPRRRCRGSVEIKLARSVSVLVAEGCGTRGRPHLPFHGYVLHDRKLPRGRGGGDLLLDALVDLRAQLLENTRATRVSPFVVATHRQTLSLGVRQCSLRPLHLPTFPCRGSAECAVGTRLRLSEIESCYAHPVHGSLFDRGRLLGRDISLPLLGCRRRLLRVPGIRVLRLREPLGLPLDHVCAVAGAAAS